MTDSGREKAATAYRTISEVADDLDLPQHVLRFWEGRFPEIRPRKGPGGRRYYRPADIELLRRIRALLYEEGYTIRGAQLALREAAEISRKSEVATKPQDDADVRRDDLRLALTELREIRRMLKP